LLLSALYFLLQLQVAAPAAAISGTVRGAAAGHPLAGVRVEEDGKAAASSDSSGHYVLAALSAGSHRLRFILVGYAPQEVGVLLADSVSQVQVNVELDPLPVHLPTVQVVARTTPEDPPTPSGGEPEIGRSSLGNDWLDRRQAGDGDAQRAIADLPGVEGRRESSAGLHVRGGGSAENLVLLDGIPLFSAVHYSGAASAVNPDAIGGAELHTGVSPARFGDHLAGVVELETSEPSGVPFQARGSVGLDQIRQTMEGYLSGIQTAVLVAGRATYRDALTSEGLDGNGYGDLLGVATTRVGQGRLRVISFSSRNRLDFSSISDATGTGGSTGVDEGALTADREEGPGVPRNGISWGSHSQGITWSRTDARGTRLEAAGWWAGSSAEVTWLAPGGAERLRSELNEIGISARAAWPAADGGTSVGGSLVRPRTRYAAMRTPDPFAEPVAGLSLDARPLVGSVFADRLWRPSRRLLVSSGLRATTDFSGWAGLEPRLTVIVTPDDRTRLGVGIGRSHQSVQSLINDESALGTLLGFDLPVAAGSGRIGVARADQLEAVAGRRLGPLDLSVTGYVRRSSGVALAPLSTPGLFPADSVVIGRGYASGLIGALDLERGRLSGRAAITLARNVRAAGGTRYDASYGQGTSVVMDLGYRVLQDTRFLVRFRGGAHQPTSVVAPGFEWRPYQPLFAPGELSGTPENLPGTVNAAMLAGYARLDLGLRRTWHLPGAGQSTGLTTALSVIDVLGRRNALGFVAGQDGSLRPIPGVGRALTFEVGWAF
jgi:hypothetical protein